LPYFSEFEIAHLNKGALAKYRTHRHGQRKLTETTINRDLECLRHILYWAVDQRILPTNPLSRLQLERARRKKRPIMSLADEDAILSAAAEHLKRIMICGLDTGMRRGEILTQRGEDIDFDRRVLSVTHSKTAEGESREIPLTNRLLELLAADSKREGLIFTFSGRPIHRIKTAWKAALRRSGVKPYRFKDIRATFNSRLIEAGVIKDVRKELMGHSRNEDTNDLYSHIELPLLREAIEKLEQWRQSQLKKEEKSKQMQLTEQPAREDAA
jgi:integrase